MTRLNTYDHMICLIYWYTYVCTVIGVYLRNWNWAFRRQVNIFDLQCRDIELTCLIRSVCWIHLTLYRFECVFDLFYILSRFAAGFRLRRVSQTIYRSVTIWINRFAPGGPHYSIWLTCIVAKQARPCMDTCWHWQMTSSHMCTCLEHFGTHVHIFTCILTKICKSNCMYCQNDVQLQKMYCMYCESEYT